jgi:hypothetical protein
MSGSRFMQHDSPTVITGNRHGVIVMPHPYENNSAT